MSTKAVGTPAPSALGTTIGTAELEDDAVTAAKLADTAVTPGAYVNLDATIDQQGRITAAANGTAYQPLDTDLTAIAALVSAADKLPYATGAGTWALADLTAAGRAILDDADAATQRATLSLGNVDNTSDATKDAAAVTLTNKSIALGGNTVTGTLAELNTAITDAEIARTDAGNTFTGNQGFGGAPSGVAGQLVLVTDNNDNNTFVRIANSNAAGTSAAAAMSTIADTAQASFVSQGSARTVSRWGAAVGGWNELLATVGSGLAMGTTTAVPLKLGTAGQAREYFSGTPKTLTESSATGIAEVSLANDTIIGGTLFYTIEAKDATDYQALRGSVPFVAVSKAGTITTTLGTPIEINAVSSGTLTNTTTITTGTAKITLNLNAVSSLTQTTLRASFRIVLDGGSGNATAL